MVKFAVGTLEALREPMITERQDQRFMKERTKGRCVNAVAMSAEMHRQTAARGICSWGTVR